MFITLFDWTSSSNGSTGKQLEWDILGEKLDFLLTQINQLEAEWLVRMFERIEDFHTSYSLVTETVHHVISFSKIDEMDSEFVLS